MDIHLSAAQPTEEEKAAVDAVLGSPDSGWTGGVRDMDVDGRTAVGGHAARASGTACCPSCTPFRHAPAGSARARSTTPAQRLDVPPAEAYGVASFYGMFSTDAASGGRDSRLRRHRLPHSGRGRDLRANWRRKLGPARIDVAAQPMPGPLRARAGALFAEAGEHPREEAVAPVTADAICQIASDRRDPVQRSGKFRAASRPAAIASCSSASAKSIREASTITARTAATKRCARPSTWVQPQ